MYLSLYSAAFLSDTQSRRQLDLEYFDLFVEGSRLKCRLRLNVGAIVTVSQTGWTDSHNTNSVHILFFSTFHGFPNKSYKEDKMVSFPR